MQSAVPCCIPLMLALPPSYFPPFCRVLTETTATVAPPFPDRPLDGFLTFNVEVTPLASSRAAAEASATSGSSFSASATAASSLARILERQIREARAIDTEALCIIPGKQVWSLRCDTRVLDDGGNANDAAALSALGSLLHFRRADVTVTGEGKAIVHTYAERAPVPLAVHHIPVCVSFALFSTNAFAPLVAAVASGAVPPPSAASSSSSSSSSSSVASSLLPSEEILLVDPTSREAEVSDGSLTFVMNAHRELCGVHKVGGCPLPPSTLVQVAKVAGEKAEALVATLRAALSAAEVVAAEKAREKHAAAAGYSVQGVVDVVGVDGRGRASSSSLASTSAAAAAPVTMVAPNKTRTGSSSSSSSSVVPPSLAIQMAVLEDEDAAFGSSDPSAAPGVSVGGKGRKGDRRSAGWGEKSVAQTLNAAVSSMRIVSATATPAAAAAAEGFDGEDEDVSSSEDEDNNDEEEAGGGGKEMVQEMDFVRSLQNTRGGAPG
jgi:exosome complex component RRP45